PFVRILLRDDIHELPTADVIGNEMAAWADPLGVPFWRKQFRRHLAGVQKRTPHHLTGIGRVVVAIERLTDDGPHAIGADHELGVNPVAVCESENGLVALLLYSRQAMSQMNSAVIEPACESLQQVGAMERVVRSAIPFRQLEPVVELEKLTGLHVAGVD